MRYSINANFKKHIISGVILILPLGVSLFFLKFIYNFISGVLSPVFNWAYPEFPDSVKIIITLILILSMLYLLGFMTSYLLGRWFWGLLERVFLRVPILNSIYRTVKEIMEVFAARKKSGFKEVVLVGWPGTTIEALGFVTGSFNDSKRGMLYRVFIPTSPNPTTGFTIIVGENDLIRSTMSIEDGIRMVVSGGIIGPEKL